MNPMDPFVRIYALFLSQSGGQYMNQQGEEVYPLFLDVFQYLYLLRKASKWEL